ncbi:MAG: ferredoxin [Dehalococcoidia bacterium]|nr:ferredoxin [Dehalococcoidia bacterium]
MRVEINRKTCLRSGQCTYLHPNVFRVGDDGYPLAPAEELPPAREAEAEDAAEICPSGAITLIDA